MLKIESCLFLYAVQNWSEYNNFVCHAYDREFPIYILPLGFFKFCFLQSSSFCLSLKGNRSNVASWPENVDNVQLFPSTCVYNLLIKRSIFFPQNLTSQGPAMLV